MRRCEVTKLRDFWFLLGFCSVFVPFNDGLGYCDVKEADEEEKDG